MKNILLLLFGITIIYLTGCDYFDNSDTLDSSTIEISISNLPALPDSMIYAAWIDNESSTIDPIVILTAKPIEGNLYYKDELPLLVMQRAQIFWLTIEEINTINDSGFAPGDRRILSGRFTNGNCNLALGESVFNFDSTSAVFNLLTPTDGNSGTDETSGIWFVQIDTADQFIAGLDLPELNQGWIYEGWVEVEGILLSTGRFLNPLAADLINQYGGSNPGLAFPGEDFLNSPPAGLIFPLDLAGKKVYVSLELNDGRSVGENPGFIIYEASIPETAESRITYQMVNVNPSIPFGNTVISVDLVK